MAKIHESMLGVMRDMNAVTKDRRNQQQNYAYRGIDDLYNELHAHLAKHGIYILPQVLEQEITQFDKEYQDKTTRWYHVRLKVKYIFTAADGTTVEAVSCSEGLDNSDKATNKAASMAFKYCLFQVFCIPTEDTPDGDKTTPTVEGKKAAPKPQAPKSEAPKDELPAYTDKRAEIEAIIARNKWNHDDTIRAIESRARSKGVTKGFLDYDDELLDRAIVYLKKREDEDKNKEGKK